MQRPLTAPVIYLDLRHFAITTDASGNLASNGFDVGRHRLPIHLIARDTISQFLFPLRPHSRTVARTNAHFYLVPAPRRRLRDCSSVSDQAELALVLVTASAACWLVNCGRASTAVEQV
jgi:hypothetical protein